MAAGDPLFGVERSVSGRRWRLRLEDERAALALTQRLDLPEIVGRILAARGVGPDEAEAFLNPTLKRFLPDPSHLLDMDKAADRLARAIIAGEPVAVFGDYDVDGATSSALISRFFGALGAPLRIYIPDRLTEGYGPNAPALLKLGQEGAGVVVTVDCGIAAHQAIAAAADAGIDVVVVDHHVAEPRLPPAYAVVNPNRLDETSPHGHLAAVGVTFLLVVALSRRLRQLGHYRDRPEPDLMAWLDLVALGTICDSVPLVGVNRALAVRGLEVMAGRGNAGLAALADVARLRERPGAYHAAFILGPRVNAGGRVGESDLGARLLTTDQPGAALALAEKLDAYNRERQAIEAVVLEAAMAAAEAAQGRSVVLVAGEGWHPGVVGIVASRLAERFYRPACVVALADGVGKGSGRSVPGADLGAAVIAARQAGLLVNGGGHRMAAGFTVAADKLDALAEFLDQRLAVELAGRDEAPSLGLDGALALSAATPELLAVIERVGPFGVGNAEPRFALGDARVARADVVGKGHVRCFLGDAGGGRLKGIAFRSADTALGRALLGARAGVLHLAGHLRADRWQGRNDVQLVIEDAAQARAPI